ncbi:oxidized purine nucleoside triphosphate hydrolase-like isoform X2 [Metopolophium dirhodum]|uniref:oxidized purine nucleoside triphosphate hydrolase-like isoform X2 n=1 Tax=Metopolophium dirhodum TaxID=44670 RepID=UPI00298F412C|nr:oxidized purine nucleoside triphosphate hydrolase-like isoform X2 [Metopolophium dirhodum]
MLSYPTYFELYPRKLMTLTFIIKNDEVLLGMKNRGMGKGKWNGFGGKKEPNETIFDAAKREVKEECGLDAISMKKIGIIDFEYIGSNEILEGHIYLCDKFKGHIVESDEMAPIKWFKINQFPLDNMWVDHKCWFPMVLKQIPFKAHFKYLDDDTIVDSTINLLSILKKTKEILVNVIVKKDNKILISNNIEESKIFTQHQKVTKGESLENVALRYLKSNYEITIDEVPKMAVVNVELTDIYSKPSIIQELHMFVLDVSKLKKFTLTNDKKFLSTLFKMKPFKAYFLINNDDILCSKYYNN